ncbi:hypothetical protein GF324_04320 [bacterium]|nr:hypothetical protein [bacterium]
MNCWSTVVQGSLARAATQALNGFFIMDEALFSAHTANTQRAAVEGERLLPDGSRLVWALSRREFGPMSFRGHPEWDVAHNRMQFLRIHGSTLDQTVSPLLEHTSNVRVVTREDRRKGAREAETAFHPVDGLVTRAADVTLLTTHADCLPIWMVSPYSGWIGLAHAGWRGIIAGIVSNLVEAVPTGERNGLTLGIGPGISSGAYEVGAEVADRFRTDDLVADAVAERDGRYYVDLADAARRQGEAAGADVDLSMFKCTYETPYLSSYRRDREAFHPMAAIITRVSG